MIKVLLKCAGPGVNDAGSAAYSSILNTSITNTLAPGVADNIRLVTAPGALFAHTDFYINGDQIPSIIGFDVPTLPVFARGECLE